MYSQTPNNAAVTALTSVDTPKPHQPRSRRVGGWRGGEWFGCRSGAPAGVSPRQLSLQPWPVLLPFPAPARQTVHAVLPHTAYRRSSPAAFDFPGPKRPGRDDDSIKADQAQMVLRSQHLGHPPSPSSAAFAPFGQPQRKPGQGIVPDLAEYQCGVAETEIPRPSAEEQVEFLHDPLDRHQQTGSGGDRPNPIPSVLNCLTRRPTTEEDQVCRPGSPPAYQPIVEAQEVHSLTAFDQLHDAGLSLKPWIGDLKWSWGGVG